MVACPAIAERRPIERAKDPVKIRAALVDATAELIAEQGLARVTVDAVARRAGVTKGGLFHHFPSKQALIDGVADGMIAQVDQTMDMLMAGDPEPHGRFTRALLAGICGNVQDDSDTPARTLCMAMLADPTMHQRWADWMAGRLERHAATDDNVPCAIARLACDGLWLSSLQTPEQPAAIAPDVKAALLAMTRAGP